MNDLSKKEDTDYLDSALSSGTSYASASEEIRYEKVGAYLLLVYQSYLKKETQLEAALKAALFRMVHFNEDYALKIRMLQLDCLKKDSPNLEGEWDENIDVLFPIAEVEIPITLSTEQEKTIKQYKEIVLGLL